MGAVLPARPLEFKAICRGSSMRLILEGAEVWRGLTFLGVLSAEWLTQEVDRRLRELEGLAALQAELQADPQRALAARKPPQVIMSTPQISPELKAQRRRDRRKRTAP